MDELQWSTPMLVGGAASFPATAAQAGIWMAHELSDRPEGFIVRVVHRIDGSLDIARLEAAIGAAIDRHEMLRATFSLSGSELMVNTFASATIALRDQPLPADEADFRHLLMSALGRRWNLLGGPLLRVVFGHVGESSYVLGFFVHHAVIDSESFTLVLRDVAAAFAGRDLADAAGARYAQLHAAQEELREDRAHDRAVARWEELLAGAPHLSRPEPRGDGAAGGREIALRRVALDPAATAELKETAVRLDATPFTVMLGKLALALGSTIGRPDVVVGTPVSTRFASGWDEVVGLFADFIPARVCSPTGPLGLEAAVEQVRVQLDLALSHPAIGFAEIVAAANPERVRDERPLFQVYLTQESPDSTRLDLAGVEAVPLDVRALQFPADIGFELTMGEEPTLLCAWDPCRHGTETIERLLSGLLADDEGGPR
jgi:hypothetical protein